jgi:predicted nucleic acid-binding protein
MSDNQIFVDTNILVYAHDVDAGGKHLIAKEKVESLWRRPILPCISIQVLQELYVNLIKKKVSIPDAQETVLNYLEWDVVDNDRFLLIEGIRFQGKWSLSLWDALIIAAAKRAKAKELWSEDLNAGQSYEGIVVINPLQNKHE